MSWLIVILVSCIIFPKLSILMLGSYIFFYFTDLVVEFIESMNLTCKTNLCGVNNLQSDNELKIKVDSLLEKIELLESKILEKKECLEKEKEEKEIEDSSSEVELEDIQT